MRTHRFLLSLCLFLSVSSLLGASTYAPVGDVACSNTMDVITDALLVRMTPKLKIKSIPDIKMGRVLLSDIKISGLDSLKRSCHVKLIVVPASKDLDVKFCVNINQLQLNVTTTLSMFWKKIKENVTINLSDMDIEVEASLPVKSGGSPVAKKTDVHRLKSIKVNSSSGVAKILNPLLKSLKGKIRNKLSKKILDAVNKKMKKIVI